MQRQCPRCSKRKTLAKFARHETCSDCRSAQEQKEEQQDEAPVVVSASHGRHLSVEQRWSIVCLHKLKRTDADVATQVSCDVRSVRHWIEHYKEHGSVEDAPRSGRKRKAPEQTPRIVAAAKAQPFTTPRSLRRELELDDLSARSIRRRLDGADLHGRVAKSEHPFTCAGACPSLRDTPTGVRKNGTLYCSPTRRASNKDRMGGYGCSGRQDKHSTRAK